MRFDLFFFFLFSLVICPLPESQEERKNKVNIEMKECLLKGGITPEFKAQVEENPNEHIIDIIRKTVGKLDIKDREAIKKCRREVLEKYKDIIKNGRINRLRAKIRENKQDIKNILNI